MSHLGETKIPWTTEPPKKKPKNEGFFSSFGFGIPLLNPPFKSKKFHQVMCFFFKITFESPGESLRS